MGARKPAVAAALALVLPLSVNAASAKKPGRNLGSVESTGVSMLVATNPGQFYKSWANA